MGITEKFPIDRGDEARNQVRSTPYTKFAKWLTRERQRELQVPPCYKNTHVGTVSKVVLEKAKIR